MNRDKRKYYRLVGFWLTSLFLFQSCSADKQETVEITVAEDFAYISLRGSAHLNDAEIKEQLQLFISNDQGVLREGQSAITGTYLIDNERVTFTPAFPLLKGKSYIARYDTGDTLIQRQFIVPFAISGARSSVAQVYPTAQVLPLNILKFYIQFTDSMARGFAYDNLHFVNDQGDTLEEVYLDLEEELWSSDMKRFTLLLDPGRIKRGLQSLEDLGYVFQQGGEYSLIVNKNWHDAHDQPMTEHFTQTFTTIDFVEEHLADFSITNAPKADTREAVQLLSASPNDYALLQRIIKVVNNKGEQIPGSIALAEEERMWLFTPEEAWQAGDYEIRIETILEDLAGNNLVNAFDVDNQKDQTVLDAPDYKILKFRIAE